MALIVRKKTPWGKLHTIGLAKGESKLSPVVCGEYWRHPVSGEEFVCDKRELHFCLPVWAEVKYHSAIRMMTQRQDGRELVPVRKTIDFPHQLQCLGKALCFLIYSEEEERFVRRYRRLENLEPRRSGKSWKIEFLVSWFLLRERGIQIAVAAQSMEASSVGIWRAIQDSCRYSAGARAHQVSVPKGTDPIVNRTMESQIVSVPADGDRLRGMDNPYLCVLDEVRAVLKAEYWIANAEAAQLSIAEPFLLTCTTAAGEPEAYEYRRWQKLCLILEKPETEPTTLPELHWLPEGEDWKDRKNWYKVTPGLGKTKKVAQMEDLFQKALGNISEERIFRLEHLNQRVNDIDGAVRYTTWQECLAEGGSEKAWEMVVSSERMLAGADLSWGRDLSSLVLVGRHPDGIKWLWQRSWMHYSKAFRMDKDTKGQVQNWVKEGSLHIVSEEQAPSSEGFVAYVAQKMLEIIQQTHINLSEFGYDPALAAPARELWREHELPISEVRQGQRLTQAITNLQDEVAAGMVRHTGDPLLTASVCTSEITYSKPHGNKTIVKAGHIAADPFVAACNAFECLFRPGDLTYLPDGSGDLTGDEDDDDDDDESESDTDSEE